MKKIICLLFIAFSANVFAQNIPTDWLGDWYGVLDINTTKGIVQTINMELHLAKTDTPNTWKYTIVYDDGKNRDERKYFLIKSDSIPGLYVVDENNGIILNEMQMGNKMFQRFKVMDNVIYGVTTYEKGKITWELISDNEKYYYQSGNGTEEIPYVYAFFPSNYQKAVLTKKKPKAKKQKVQKEKDDKK